MLREPPALRMEPNPLQQALDNYQQLSRELEQLRGANNELRATNAALVAETGILREHLRAAENDRVRLQAIASTMLGRLLSINDTIAGAVKASIREGIEAAQSHAEAQDRSGQALERPQEPARSIFEPPPSQSPAMAQIAPEPRQRSQLAPVEFRR